MTGLPDRLAGLLDAGCFGDGGDEPQLIETHISWVVLTGQRAFKIKKPVELGFVDYRTLDSRKKGCEAELRLNQRFAPQLYLDVVALTVDNDALSVNGEGRIVDYAVRMRQFPQAAQLDKLLDSGRVDTGMIRSLGRSLARLYAQAAPAEPGDPALQPAVVIRQMRDNLPLLRGALTGVHADALRTIERWIGRDEQALTGQMQRRLAAGNVREGHGDLHTANLVLLDGALTAFDCIEFDRAYRVIDVISDIAFLIMDLAFHESLHLAHVLLCAYLEHSGDYGGLKLLRFYLTYRALVRAKIAVLSDERSLAQRYVDLALSIGMPARRPTLVLMHGYSGSGKTFVSDRLIAALPAIRVRSDLERKRLAGLSADASSESAIGSGLYAPLANERTYAKLGEIARGACQAGLDLIVDAAFLSAVRRRAFCQIAEETGASCVIVDCLADRDRLERALRQRTVDGADASEADVAVLNYQMQNADPLTHDERAVTVSVPADEALPADVIARRIRRVGK